MIRFTVVGVPAPQGSKRYVGRPGGRGVLVESSKRVKPWRADVREAALAVAPETPIAGAVAVRFEFRMPVPKSAPKRRRLLATRRPDADKLARSTLDALSGVLFVDDNQIVRLVVEKDLAYDARPGVSVTVWDLEGQDALA